MARASDSATGTNPEHSTRSREAEVLAVISGRVNDQEIAERLCISVRTVESHVSALLRKLGYRGGQR